MKTSQCFIICLAALFATFFVVSSNVFARSWQKNIEETISINPNAAQKSIEGYSIFQSIEYVKLETKSTCLLDRIVKVLITSDRLYVLSYTTGQVYCFNREGKYLFTLNKRGRGPRETGEIRDIALDLSNQRILLSDADKRSVYFYSYDGELIDRLKFRFFIYDIIPLGNDLVAFRTSESNSFDFKLYNTTTKEFTYEAMEMYPLDDITSGSNMLSTFGNRVLFAPSLRDTIYEVTTRGLSARYRINFGQHALPETIRREQGRVSYFYFHRENQNYAGMLSQAWETNLHIGFVYKYSKQTEPIQVIVSKKNKKIYQFESIGIDGIKIPTKHKLFRSSHNVNYGIIDPVIITGEVRANSVPYGRFKSLKEVAAKTSVDDNSIIAIYTLNPNF